MAHLGYVRGIKWASLSAPPTYTHIKTWKSGHREVRTGKPQREVRKSGLITNNQACDYAMRERKNMGATERRERTEARTTKQRLPSTIDAIDRKGRVTVSQRLRENEKFIEKVKLRPRVWRTYFKSKKSYFWLWVTKFNLKKWIEHAS